MWHDGRDQNAMMSTNRAWQRWPLGDPWTGRELTARISFLTSPGFRKVDKYGSTARMKQPSTVQDDKRRLFDVVVKEKSSAEGGETENPACSGTTRLPCSVLLPEIYPASLARLACRESSTFFSHFPLFKTHLQPTFRQEKALSRYPAAGERWQNRLLWSSWSNPLYHLVIHSRTT